MFYYFNYIREKKKNESLLIALKMANNMFESLWRDKENDWKEHHALTDKNYKDSINKLQEEVLMLRFWIKEHSTCKTCGGDQHKTLGMIPCKECGLCGLAPWGG